MMKRSLIYQVLFILYFFTAVACSNSADPGELGGCKQDEDCLGQRSCVDSRCIELEDVGINEAPDSSLDSGSDVGAADTCDDISCAVDEVCYGGVCYDICDAQADCGDGNRCHDNRCLSTDCSTVDCGDDETCYFGACYPSCLDDNDCKDQGQRCEEQACVVPSCDDGVRNGDETDVDCGGDCSQCQIGASCLGASDCQSGVCEAATCRDPLSCENVRCLDGEVCYRGVCYPMCSEDRDCDDGLVCSSGSCVDPCEGVQCPSEQSCYRGGCYDFCDAQADCGDGAHRCHDNRCLSTDCSNVDCRDDETCYFGACYPSCLDDNDCKDQGQRCEEQACVVPSCDDGVRNGDETDVDCGGGCQACGLEQGCAEDDDCQSDICFENQCVQCTNDEHCPHAEVCYQNSCALCDADRHPFGGGTGSRGNPHRICSPAQLDSIRGALNAHFKLYDDIDLSGIANFEPIGKTLPVSSWFLGSLDGNGFEIRNLSINRPTRNAVGLFGHISDFGRLSNVRLVDLDIKGGVDVGGLVGSNDGEIEDSYATGQVTGGNVVGGLVGRNSGAIKNSYATGQVTGENEVGGLVGGNMRMDWGSAKGRIENSYATGKVTGYLFVGGLVGENMRRGRVENSYATGEVTGELFVGGLVGENDGEVKSSYASGEVMGESMSGGLVGENGGEVENCYATGEVMGESEIGGLVGENIGKVKNCYATGQVTGYRMVGGLVGTIWDGSQIDEAYWKQDLLCSGCDNGFGTELTAEEFSVKASFVGWAFDVIWKMGDSRPLLMWEED